MRSVTSLRVAKVSLALALLTLVAPARIGVIAKADHIARVLEGYGRLPLTFEANQGQTDAHVKFLSRGNGRTLYLTSSEMVLTVTNGIDGTVLRMKTIGGNSPSRIEGLQQLPGTVNYFIGNDPSKWRTNIPTYARVQYQNVYPGVDLIYYGNQRQLEYDFVIAPGGDPGAIKVAFEGAAGIESDASGDLTVRTAGGELRMHKPFVYQEVGGVKHAIAGRYVLENKDHVSFEVATYDRSKTLVIDPVLAYSTYLGGSLSDSGFGIAVDSTGNAYVTGSTNSANFPTTIGAFDRSMNSSSDVFVTKLDPTGSTLVYSTYIGGASGARIAVDAAGGAYVTGITDSTNFPTTAGAFDRTYNGPVVGQTGDVFVTKLNAGGSALVYSTYVGGSGFERANGIAVDAGGNAYVAGRTVSANFPITAGAFQTVAPGGESFNPQDAFVAKLNPAGSALVYSTYLGGSRNDEGNSTAVDSGGNAYVTGFTSSTNFPTTATAFAETFTGFQDTFVSKLNASGSALVYSTYLRGSIATGIAVDSAGRAYVTGSAGSNFATTAGAFAETPNGLGDAFVATIDPSQSGIASLVYSTYLGGSGLVDQGLGIAVDFGGGAVVTGTTSSIDFPTTADAFQIAHGGGPGFVRLDAFVAKIDPSRNGIASLVYSTYLGGSGQDDGRGIAVDSAGSAYVSASTSSLNFPTTAGAFDRTFNNGADAYVAKFLFNQRPLSDAGSDETVSVGTDCRALVALNGTGSADPDGDTLVFTWTGEFGTATGATPTVTLPVGSHIVTLAVDDGKGGTASDTVVFTVFDSTGPIIGTLTASPASLWPANHRMVPVAVTGTVADNCAGPIVCQIVSVSSNEPIDGLGDGDTAPDWELIGDLSVSLRAERSGIHDGRIYSITVTCTDAAGNSTTKAVAVTVAHDQAKK